MKKRMVITGGHLSPAVAVIQKLRRLDWEIFFLGRKLAFFHDNHLSFEYATISEFNIKFVDISPVRLKSEISISNIISIFLFPITILRSILLLKKINPKCVLTFGGYVGLPVCLAAIFLKIPLLIHEQTLRPGRANILLSKFACQVLAGWEEALPYFAPEKTILVGNPLREEINKKTRNLEWKRLLSGEKLPLLYITGGTTGAHGINEKIGSMLFDLVDSFCIIHQCGESYYKDFQKLQKIRNKLSSKLKARYLLFKNLDAAKTNNILNKADIIIGRSGANTVCEVAVLGKAAIFIPHPFSAFSEQRLNAQKLVRNGSALILEEKDLNKANLLKSLKFIIKHFSIFYEKADKFSQSSEIQKHLHASSKIGYFLDNNFSF